MSNPNRLFTVCRLVLAAGLALPYAAMAADATSPPKAATSASQVKTPTPAKPAADVKAGGRDSAPGCDESQGGGKKGPGIPKCPELNVNKAVKQQ